MAPCRDACALAAASLGQEGVPPQCTGERRLGRGFGGSQSSTSLTAGKPSAWGNSAQETQSGLWPVCGQGALQGLERDSQPDAKGGMDALSSSHFKKAGLPLPYLGNFERRLEKGTKHM